MKYLNRGASPRFRQQGVGLVEVLVAVLILAFGMLGLVGLQLANLRNNESALQRGMAVAQMHSIADAMRADRANAGAGRFNIEYADGAPTGTTFADVALSTWKVSLLNLLGAGATGRVACVETTAILCTISVRWNDQRGSGGDAANSGGNPAQEITTDVQL